jgi:hypothetical protein
LQTLAVGNDHLVLARYTTLLSGLRLQAAVGDLQDDDLQQINALLR